MAKATWGGRLFPLYFYITVHCLKDIRTGFQTVQEVMQRPWRDVLTYWPVQSAFIQHLGETTHNGLAPPPSVTN